MLIVLKLILFIATVLLVFLYTSTMVYMWKRHTYLHGEHRDVGLYDDYNKALQTMDAVATHNYNINAAVVNVATEEEDNNTCNKKPKKCTSDTDCDCNVLCNTKKTVTQLKIWDTDEVYLGNTLLGPGLYCIDDVTGSSTPLVEVLASCPEYYAYVRFFENTWRCVSKYPDIFNINDTQILTMVACKDYKNATFKENQKNVLLDTMTNEEVNFDTVDDLALIRQTISKDELHPEAVKQHFPDNADSRYLTTRTRLRCSCNALTTNGSKMVGSIYAPMRCMPDSCLTGLYQTIAPGITYDDDTASVICDCGDVSETRVSNMLPNVRHSKCTNCPFVWMPNDSTSLVRLRVPCYVSRTLLVDTQHVSYPCPEPTSMPGSCMYASFHMKPIVPVTEMHENPNRRFFAQLPDAFDERYRTYSFNNYDSGKFKQLHTYETDNY